jgi:hypothetical protein
MSKLLDINNALTKDLPFKLLCEPQWTAAARLALRAADTGMMHHLLAACAAMVEALDREGWMSTRKPAMPSLIAVE